LSDLLIVLNPRRIAECLTAIDALDIDKLWVSRYSEKAIETWWPSILEAADGYDRLLMISDDTFPRQQALDAVTSLLDDGHPVVTGYSNLSAADWRANISIAPLAYPPSPDAYTHPPIGYVLSYPEPAVPTYVTGLTLCGMTRHMWETYPFEVWGKNPAGCCSDYMLSWRLQEDGVAIVAAREAFIFHLKDVWGIMDVGPRKRLLIGEEPAELRLDVRVPA